MPEPPRTPEERKRDVVGTLESEVDGWLASASEHGDAYLIPISFYWDGQSLLLATPESSLTVRNLRRAGVARLGIGPTRDVVIIDGAVEFIDAGAIDPALAERYAEETGWDPRTDGRNVFFRIVPRTIQAWREANELAGRHVMKDGRWLV